MDPVLDMTALFRLGYGLYVITSWDGTRHNGMIANTVMQTANDPTCIAVSINKANFTHEIIRKSGRMNVNCLTTDAPFRYLSVLDSKVDVMQIKCRGYRFLILLTVWLC